MAVHKIAPSHNSVLASPLAFTTSTAWADVGLQYGISAYKGSLASISSTSASHLRASIVDSVRELPREPCGSMRMSTDGVAEQHLLPHSDAAKS